MMSMLSSMLSACVLKRIFWVASWDLGNILKCGMRSFMSLVAFSAGGACCQ
jgi:hypothetical protein